MIREEEKDEAPGRNWKSYSRSMSWTERPPRKTTTSKPQWNSKARSCLPPLQPLSITRPNIEEWPRAGSDDLGVWPNPPTPGARRGSVTPRENSTADQPPREFEFRKDKLAFFNKECSRILDHIYLGSDSIAKDREILRQNGITHVLNCVGFVCPEYFKNELVYKTLWLQDSPSEDITSIFYDVFDYFEDVREQGGRVLVHCCQGVSRSTSLVIAYLMWKEGQSFDDAFEHVKAARGVTDPNVGFACQLLQCQKRVHALPASPTSVLRMYRMAPHSPYDPLHLVPKMLCEPGTDKLDSRGAFIIHVPSALYVWIGKHCSPMMEDNAKAAASQVIRYERAQGPVKTIEEGEETSEFWTALSCGRSSTDGCPANTEKGMHLSAIPEMVPATAHQYLNQRKLSEYDLDFEIFHGALSGGVVPPFPISETGSEMCLPFRENGWNRLRRKFASGVVKDFIATSKLNATVLQIYDGIEAMGACKEVEDFTSSSNHSIPSTGQCDSPDSVSSYVFNSPGWNNNEKEVECPSPPDTNLSRSPSFSLVDSFSSFLVNKPNSTSSSPSLSPSTSDISTSFSFSPSSSNWSDLSFSSPQPSPCGLESSDMDSSKSSHLDDGVSTVGDNAHMLDNAISSPQKETTSIGLASVTAGLCRTYGRTVSLVECRGSNVSFRTSWPSTDKAPLIAKNFEDDKMWDSEEKNCRCEVSVKGNGEEPVSVTNGYVADNAIFSVSHDGRKYNTFHLVSDDVTNKITDSINPVVYRWPSVDKMDICGLLDSRSVYIIGLPSVCASSKETDSDILYVWIGHNVPLQGSYSELIKNYNKCEDSDVHKEIINCDLLIEMGFSKNAQVKIVKEGDEPEQLRKLVAGFSLTKE